MRVPRTSERDGGTEQRPAVVLLSGGLDSTTAMAVARAEGFACYALTIDYGQRHRVELTAAAHVAAALGARELGVDLSLTWTCYDPGPELRACGVCDACILREKGFAEAGVDDPLRCR